MVDGTADQRDGPASVATKPEHTGASGESTHSWHAAATAKVWRRAHKWWASVCYILGLLWAAVTREVQGLFRGKHGAAPPAPRLAVLVSLAILVRARRRRSVPVNGLDTAPDTPRPLASLHRNAISLPAGPLTCEPAAIKPMPSASLWRASSLAGERMPSAAVCNGLIDTHSRPHPDAAPSRIEREVLMRDHRHLSGDVEAVHGGDSRAWTWRQFLRRRVRRRGLAQCFGRWSHWLWLVLLWFGASVLEVRVVHDSHHVKRRGYHLSCICGTLLPCNVCYPDVSPLRGVINSGALRKEAQLPYRPKKEDGQRNCHI